MADLDASTRLSEELKEYASTLDASTFPKNFFCTSCHQLAFDSWKLLCCNKAICSSCHDKLQFPTSCPLCDHSPLEADTCAVNKVHRNTMRTWLTKKKKQEAKSAPKVEEQATPAASATPDVHPTGDALEHVVTSVEGTQAGEGMGGHASPPEGVDGPPKEQTDAGASPQAKEARAHSVHHFVNTMLTWCKPSINEERHGSVQSQSENPAESTTENPESISNMDGSNNGNFGSNGAFNNSNGMNGGPMMGYGFNPSQGNFNGMGWNGMNPMGMPNSMGGGNWNMNNMGMFEMNNMNMPNMPNGMFSGYGGNMGMAGMNDMSAMNMNYGGGYGNGWNGQMNGGGGYGNFNGYGQMGGYNQSGQFPQMMNSYPKNNFQNQNRFQGAFAQQKNNRKGSFGSFGSSGAGLQQNHSRPSSQAGAAPSVRRSSTNLATPLAPESDTDVSSRPQHDGESSAGNVEAASSTHKDGEPTEASAALAQGEANDEDKADVVATPSVHAEGDKSVEATKEGASITSTADVSNERPQESGLNQIQTVDSADNDAPTEGFEQGMMDEAMHPDSAFAPPMNDFLHQGQQMNGHYNSGMGYNQNNYANYGPRGGYNAAYGAATVLTGEPRGLGVEGAPTGPRAMREGRPNTGFSSRASNLRSNVHAAVSPAVPAQNVAPDSPARRARASPERDESLRVKEKSVSRSPSPSKSRAFEDGLDASRDRERSRTPEVDQDHKHRTRSQTPTSEYDHERRKDKHRHRSSRYDDEGRDDRRDDEYDDRHREEDRDRDERDRTPSDDSKYRSSRRDKDRHRSSRSHRDRGSRERRHRHRSRSRSPLPDDRYEEDEDRVNGTEPSAELSSRRKGRSEREKHRERSRERDRDRDRRDRRDRDRERDYDYDYDYDYDREKDRSRDKDRDRKRSRRDREDGYEDEYYDDDKYRSSRRSRKDKDRSDRDRDRDRDVERAADPNFPSVRPPSPPLNAPTGPAADSDFSIRGFSKQKNSLGKPPTPTTATMPPPPTGPRALQPPTGPAAHRDREPKDHRHRRTSSASIPPTTPTTPSADHYAAERERNVRAREQLERDRGHTSSSRPSLSSKRSHDDFERDNNADDRKPPIPTGPANQRNNKRRKSGEDAITNMFTMGMRKHGGSTGGRRRGGVRVEGEAEREVERGERERDRSRW
ncbi:hypothetical protein EJ04DRAFT_551431 [Polyplosphaeria fusca]|uniref:RING-type domain-containing protein n=1 Tax=Polyplosphaeria fusca TaxID=682080 RepID=A0A9P4R4A0_9PLEO|nr:hypothetical protein EJ04DRAFT_551431 [Polyplosphaeria fusca]